MTGATDSPRLAELLGADDPESVFIDQIRRIIAARRRLARPHHPSDPLRLLLVGYSGAGNTGADVRVSEMIRQLRAILGARQTAIGLTIVGDQVPTDVFAGAEQIPMREYVVDFLDAHADRYDGMLACEGSMFKSKNSNIFSGVMAATLGIADAQGKLAVGYGADVGPMDPLLENFVVELGSGPLILARSPESAAALQRLGLRAEEGTDTAWTYDPAPPQRAREALESLGWSGSSPILVVCPVNPFWWPVKIDLVKSKEMELTGAHRHIHYGSFFFHQDSEDRRLRYDRYLNHLAAAARAWRDATQGWVLIVGMERIDRHPCADLAERLGFASGRILSGESPVSLIVGALRLASVLISSRYHAIVTSMPAGVPAIGVSMDERIANLMHGYGAGERLLQVDDPHLADRLVAAIGVVGASAELVAEGTRREVARHLQALGRMGAAFAVEAGRVYPGLSLPSPEASWERFLPELSPLLETLLERYT